VNLEVIKTLLPEEKTIEIIKSFLLDQELLGNIETIGEASSYLLEVYYKLKNYSSVISLAKEILDKRYENSKINLQSANLAIEAMFTINDLANFPKFFSVKEELIKLIDSDQLLFDQLRYHLLSGNYEEFLNLTTEYLLISADINKRNFCYLELTRYYFAEKAYEKAKNYNQKLLSSLPYRTNIPEALVHELEILHIYKDERTYDLSKDLLLERKIFSDEQLQRILFVRLILLAEEKSEHKLFVLQTEYEDLFETLPEEKRKTYYEICLQAYWKTGGFAKTIFQEKLRSLEKKKEPKPEVIKPIVNLEIKVPQPLPKEKAKAKTETKSLYHALLKLQSHSNAFSTDEKYREYLRHLGIFLNEYHQIDEFVLNFPEDDNEEGHLFYNFKAGRLYESRKKIIENTFFKALVNLKEPLVVDLDRYLDIRCPASSKFYAAKGTNNIIVIPLLSKNRGNALLVAEVRKLEFEFVEDTGKVLTEFINLARKRLELSQIVKGAYFKTESYQKLFLEIDIPMKIEADGLFILNPAAIELFSSNVKNIEDLFKVLDNNYLNSYKDKYQALINGSLLTFKQDFQIRNQKTYYYEVARRNKDVLISYYIDQTEEVLLKQTENRLITYNQKYNILNDYSLAKRITGHIKEKFSLLIMEIHRFNEIAPFFTYDQKNQLNKELIRLYENYGTVYYHAENQFIVYLEFNDSRSVKRTVSDLNDAVENFFALNYHQFSLSLNIAYLRYPVTVSEADPDKILGFLDISLSKAQKLKFKGVSSIVEFQKPDFLKDRREEALISAVIEGFKNRQYTVKYYPVYLPENGKLSGYLPKLEFANISFNAEYIYKTFAQRKLVYDLDLFSFSIVMAQSYKIMKIKDKSIRVFIRAAEESISNPQFIKELALLAKNYPNLASSVTIIISEYNEPFLDYSENIKTLKLLGFKIFGNNPKDLFLDKADGIFLKPEYLAYYPAIKDFSYGKNLEFITEKIEENILKDAKYHGLYLINKKGFVDLEKYYLEEDPHG